MYNVVLPYLELPRSTDFNSHITAKFKFVYKRLKQVSTSTSDFETNVVLPCYGPSCSTFTTDYN